MTEWEAYPSTQTLPAPIATPHGPGPTSTRAVTAFVAGSIRTRVPSPLTPTQTKPKPPVSEHGPAPAGILATTLGVPLTLLEPRPAPARQAFAIATTTTVAQVRVVRPMYSSELVWSACGPR